MSANSNHPVVLFDGVCNVCNGAVAFIIKRDPKARFRFAALQSRGGAALLRGRGDAPDSIVLVEGEQIAVRSTAALRIVRQLRGLWPLLYVFIVIPRPLRDWVYAWVAKNRYRWFGRRDACMMPTPELRARFLDAGDEA